MSTTHNFPEQGTPAEAKPEAVPALVFELCSLGAESLPNIDTFLAMNSPRQGKDLHHAVNRLVWGFRERHGYELEAPKGGEKYLAELARFEQLEAPLDVETQAKIDTFAEPEHYREVRGAGRMRASRMVSEAELHVLAREVRVALMWRELIARDPALIAQLKNQSGT